MSNASSHFDPLPLRTAVSEAVLTEAVYQVDIVHTSLAGMTAIVVMLLVAVALPIFGLAPVKHPIAFGVMTIAAFVGIGGLYFMNYRVHKHVTNQSRLTEVLVNSLGQGFLVFDRNGNCGNVYSQACLDLLETVPAGKNIVDVLLIPEDQKVDFKDWLDILFQPDHALGFDDVIKFLPQYFPHSQKRRINLVYRPIYTKEGPLISVVVIATDLTEEFAAREVAKHQQNFAEMICRIFKERNKFYATIAHVRAFLGSAAGPGLEQKDNAPLLRQLHTLKATVKQFNLLELAEVIHAVENDLRAPTILNEEMYFREVQIGRQKIAASLERVSDEIGAVIGKEYEWRGNIREIEETDLYKFAQEMQSTKADPALIRLYLRTIAAVPIRECFHSFERELQELASIMDKQIKPIYFDGSNPRVLTQPIQEFLFLLTHLCRNIMDHGIESPVTRMARGKDPAGLVTIWTDVILSADGSGEDLQIIISDDGNGVDPSRIRAKLATLDPDGAWRFEDDQAIIQRIFTWGFTTSDKLTTISGHGVGMEAIEREIRKLGGTIRVISELYKGTSFDIRLPYCLDIEQIGSPKRV